VNEAPGDSEPSERDQTERVHSERGEMPESLTDVLASIRALVAAETTARVEGVALADVLLLTPGMRVDAAVAPWRAGELLADGLAPRARPIATAPIFDEEALRGMINEIVREELQGELGDRISRNLRKLIRREMAQMLTDDRAVQTGQTDTNQ